MKILHISDTHAQGDTLVRLEHLALRFRNCDVVASTGDNACKGSDISSWNKWPQRLKLSIPGNHGDDLETYSQLKTWKTEAPWYVEEGGFCFIGLDSARGVEQQLKEWASSFNPEATAVVVLSDQRQLLFPLNDN